jgi:hypothetical protein
MFTNRPNANRCLTLEDVRRHEEVLSTTRLLFVSGYCFMDPRAPRVEAAQWAVKAAKRTPTGLVVFDVVPHKFHTVCPNRDAFLKLIEGTDLLVSELNTIRRLFQLGHRGEVITAAMVEETRRLLSRVYPGSFDLRFGEPTHIERQLLWDARQKRSDERDSPKWDQWPVLRGYGDWLTLVTLRDFFRLGPGVARPDG